LSSYFDSNIILLPLVISLSLFLDRNVNRDILLDR